MRISGNADFEKLELVKIFINNFSEDYKNKDFYDFKSILSILFTRL